MKVKFNENVFSVAESWDELTPKQFMDIVRAATWSWSVVELRLKVLLILLNALLLNKEMIRSKGREMYTFKYIEGGIFLLSPGQVADLLSLTDFIFGRDDQGNTASYILSRRTLNPVRSVVLRQVKYHGPEDRLFNLTFEEFMAAENYYMQFLESKDMVAVNKLCAALYRPRDRQADPRSPDYKGDLREAFNDHIVTYRSGKFARLPIATRMGIFYWFQGCREFLTNQFSNVFRGESSGRDKNPFGMMVLVDALAQNDVTKNEKIRKGMLYDVMLRLEQAAIQKMELEKLKSKRHA